MAAAQGHSRLLHVKEAAHGHMPKLSRASSARADGTYLALPQTRQHIHTKSCKCPLRLQPLLYGWQEGPTAQKIEAFFCAVKPVAGCQRARAYAILRPVSIHDVDAPPTDQSGTTNAIRGWTVAATAAFTPAPMPETVSSTACTATRVACGRLSRPCWTTAQSGSQPGSTQPRCWKPPRTHWALSPR